MNSNFLLFLLISVIECVSFGSGFSQSIFRARELPKQYTSSQIAIQRSVSVSRYPNAVDLTSYLQPSYVKDGTKDYTVELQKGINENEIVQLPNFPILVNKNGISLKDRSVLIFQPKSKLILAPTSVETYNIISIHNVKDVQVINANIVGDRYNHNGSTGQWGMGIGIRSSTNVTLINPVVSECWGDGIYIGQIGYVPSVNIVVQRAVLNKNRRNGISVTNVDGLKISSPVISNTYGQDPGSGIDIEPNSNKDVINNIEISNPVTFNNAKYGIIVSLTKLKGNLKKDVNIKILNHVDDSSSGGLAINRILDNDTGKPLTGNIKIDNSTWKNSRGKYPLYYLKKVSDMNINLNNYNVVSEDANGNLKKNFNQMKAISAKIPSN